jgi:hypothetical protein
VFLSGVFLAGGWIGTHNVDALRIDRYGDINCDGPTDSVDAQLILQQDAALIKEQPCSFRGDVSGDGRLDALDALVILQWIAGLIDTLPP